MLLPCAVEVVRSGVSAGSGGAATDPSSTTQASLPGSRHDLDYAQSPNHRATGILNNTVGGTNQLPLPGPFELGPRGPWLQY